MPHPISTPTRLGHTLSPMVIVVPIVQPAPAWMSGIFIEADKDEDGNIYIVIHSGSRHLGLEIANYYQEAGYKALTTYSWMVVKVSSA